MDQGERVYILPNSQNLVRGKISAQKIKLKEEKRGKDGRGEEKWIQEGKTGRKEGYFLEKRMGKNQSL